MAVTRFGQNLASFAPLAVQSFLLPARFLKRKIEEYEEIKRQIQLLTREIELDGLPIPAEPKEAAATTA